MRAEPGGRFIYLNWGVLVGRLGLTDAKGNPVCASIRPPLIEWSAAVG